MSLEIERKFLVAVSPDWSHPVLNNARLIEYEQVYLQVNIIEQTRIRRGVVNGTASYHFAHLRRVDDGKREVTEREIELAEYEWLRDQRDPRRKIIHKHRHSFHWHGHLLELDEIFEPASRACHLLEIQVDNLSQQIKFARIPADRPRGHDRTRFFQFDDRTWLESNRRNPWGPD